MSADNVLAAQLAANLLTPAEKAQHALDLVVHLVASEAKPAAALWALMAVVGDLTRAAHWMERAELHARLTPEQQRARCVAEADVEAEETT
jgi:hypothetical protein